MATDEQIVGSARSITLGGKAFEVYPLSDKDLVSLTQWIRYRIGKEAREEAKFAESHKEAEAIKREAFQRARETEWFTDVGVSLLLNDSEGLCETIFRMIKKCYKKDWFADKFGAKSEITKEQLKNRKIVQDTFLAQNTIHTDLEEEEDDSPPQPEKKD